MSTVGQTGNVTNNYDTMKTASAYKASESSKTGAASKNYGNTIGEVELSDKAAKYYEKLKSKYSDMDFVLVSNSEINGAEQKAAQFANSGRTMVLIDAEKIEKMAEDEEYRKKYEGIIGNASSQLDALAEKMGAGSLANVKTFGIKVDDKGNTSYFAVVDKSLAQQRERIEKKHQEQAEAKKAAGKDAEKERAEAAREKNRTDRTGRNEGGNLETVSASSIEELIKKLNDGYYAGLSDNVRTDQEKMVGSQFDFSL